MHQFAAIESAQVAPDEANHRSASLAADRWAGRRLADVVNEAFQIALARRDVLTAEDLLAVMERAWEREQAKTRFDRRHADPLLGLARRELQTVKAKRKRS